jgi:hypothetical protein
VPPRWWWAALGGLVALAAMLHVLAGFVFPRPWPDESHFLAPALRLAFAGTLAVPELNAPEGIFWMPTGYYAVLAPLLRLGLDPLSTARAVSLAGVCVFATLLAGVVRRAGLPPVVAVLVAAAWLSTPRVVAAANLGRMESVVLALTAVALWLLASDRWPGALAVASVAPLIHPVGVVVALPVAAAWFMRADRPPWARWEIALVVVAAAVWLLELTYVLRHLDVARDHLGFQLRRKSSRGVELGWWAPLALTATALLGGRLTRTWRRSSPPWVALWAGVAMAGGFIAAEVAGQEIWYGVLGRETAVVLVAVAVLAALTPATRRRWRLEVVPTLAVAAVATALVWTFGFGWFRAGPDLQSRAEWRAYVDDTVAQLRALDAAAGAPATVLLDPLSGVGQEVFARPWERLEFVQPTPATPRSAVSADYVVLTPGAPLVTRSLRTTWGVQEPLVALRSERGRFRLEVYANPDR